MNYRTMQVLLGLMVVSGCSHKKYRVKQLLPLTEQNAEFCETKENVTVKAKNFTPQDSKDFFYGSTLSSYKRGKKQSIIPLHITVDNARTSPIRYIVCSKNDLVRDAEVAQLLHISSVGPIVVACIAGYGIGINMFLVWLIATMGNCPVPAATYVSSAIITGGLIALPIVYAHYRTHVNALIDKQLALNRLPATQEIPESGSANGLIYCKNVVDELCLSVYENDQCITTFNITL